MIRGLAAVAAAAMMAGPAAAQDEAVRACLRDAVDKRACIGASLDPCLAAPGGETTTGISACIVAETEAWDRMLNDEYQQTMAAFRALDATGDVAGRGLERSPTLREAQRAWIAFRDAECELQYARWGLGTMRQIAGANCLLAMTAERAIKLVEMRGP